MSSCFIAIEPLFDSKSFDCGMLFSCLTQTPQEDEDEWVHFCRIFHEHFERKDHELCFVTMTFPGILVGP